MDNIGNFTIKLSLDLSDADRSILEYLAQRPKPLVVKRDEFDIPQATELPPNCKTYATPEKEENRRTDHSEIMGTKIFRKEYEY